MIKRRWLAGSDARHAARRNGIDDDNHHRRLLFTTELHNITPRPPPMPAPTRHGFIVSILFARKERPGNALLAQRKRVLHAAAAAYDTADFLHRQADIHAHRIARSIAH